MIDVAIWIFVVVAFGGPIAQLLRPSLLERPSFRFCLAAAQVICAMVMYGWALTQNKVWLGVAIILLIALYNFWVGLQLKKGRAPS